MKMILIEAEELAAMLRQAVREEIAQSGLNNKSKHSPGEQEFITLEEAQKIIPYTSKSKWQQLRNHPDIVISRISPRRILFEKKSLIEFIRKKKLNF